MSVALTQQRCFHHVAREAVARCPGCGHFYCRECITEHDRRVLCASCLRRSTAKQQRTRRGLLGVWRATQTLAGVFLVWLFFYWLGQILLSLPTGFHDASVWTDEVLK